MNRQGLHPDLEVTSDCATRGVAISGKIPTANPYQRPTVTVIYVHGIKVSGLVQALDCLRECTTEIMARLCHPIRPPA